MKSIILSCVTILAFCFSQTMYVNNNEQVRLAPRMLNYQGYLTDTLGIPITNLSLAMIFAIFDAASAGNQKWTEIQPAVSVNKGIFHVLLGSITPIPDTVFNNTSRWLELTVGGQILAPRTRIVSAAYSYTSTYSDTAVYARISATDNDWKYLISDGADTILQMGGKWGLARAGNILYGIADSTHVNFGVACTTGLSGYNYKYCTVGGGRENSAVNELATVSGGYGNFAVGDASTVGGGRYNVVNNYCATIAGGEWNSTGNNYSTVGGGGQNAALGSNATVGGGWSNQAMADNATVSGGSGNIAEDNATVAGGCNNSSYGYAATVGGGWLNSAFWSYSTVGGGYADTALGQYAFVGGGRYNRANADYTTVCGGNNNRAEDVWATVGGGGYNSARSWATVGGGGNNNAWGPSATIGGGDSNNASGGCTSIGGGLWNNASGDNATISGGVADTASGAYAAIGGGYRNRASGMFATIGGGINDTASGNWATISGGAGNHASGPFATISGGEQNMTSGSHSTVGGGCGNTAGNLYSTVSGGWSNYADSTGAIAGGYGDTVMAPYGFAANLSAYVLGNHSTSAAFTASHTIGPNQVRAASFSTGTVDFAMDHPDDPMNKILNQYAVGSDEVMLMYSGSVVLDEKGHAVVNLPDYFGDINRNPRVLLTGVGSSDVYVTEDISGNRFVIGGKSNIKVYWQVIAERKDIHAEIARINTPVVQEKTGNLRGHSIDDDAMIGMYDGLHAQNPQLFQFKTEEGGRVHEQAKGMTTK